MWVWGFKIIFKTLKFKFHIMCIAELPVPRPVPPLGGLILFCPHSAISEHIICDWPITSVLRSCARRWQASQPRWEHCVQAWVWQGGGLGGVDGFEGGHRVEAVEGWTGGGGCRGSSAWILLHTSWHAVSICLPPSCCHMQNTREHISLPHALNPSAVCAFCTHVNSIITPKKHETRTTLAFDAHWRTYTLASRYTPCSVCANTLLNTHTNAHTDTPAPLNPWPGRMEPVCSEAASRQGQGRGFAGACVCEGVCVCVCVCWGCGGLGNAGRFWEGPWPIRLQCILSK